MSARAAGTLVALLLAAAGPAAAVEPDERDPFERVNRATFAFNDALDRMLARPAARAYRRVVPEPARTAVSNFVANLEYPTTILNSALQGKFGEAGTGTARFVVNSTVGVAGLWDPATRLGLEATDEDFGQTLGHWGVPSGPYLVVPVFGPSSVRDAPSRFVDRYTNARRYVGDGDYTEYALWGVDVLDTRAELLAAQAALETAFDPYALVRNAFLQRREYLVRDGDVPEEEFEDFGDEPVEEDVEAEPGAEPGDGSGDPDAAAPEATEAPVAPEPPPDAAPAPAPAVPPPGG